jgi:diacylglycerol kinase (ATP)
MGQFQKGLFIINPHSGRKNIPRLERTIINACYEAGLEFTITNTERPGHATQLAKAAQGKYDLVFAVGGDGTANEVAKGLILSDVTMGIIPKGSGNGLARHLGISMKPSQALSLIQTGSALSIDTLSVNGEVSVNVSGIGFDGFVANLFKKAEKRGLQEYVALAVREFVKFKPFLFSATIDGRDSRKEAFIVAFANSSQFGNNATISPTASVCDGLLDICIIKKIPLLHIFGFVWKMFTRRLDNSSFVEIIRAKKVSVSFSNPMPAHVDGEGRDARTDFTIEVMPASLKVLVEKNLKGLV